jgi:flavin reductase (DIM6/NTAB) family NADH-FMN oxidoreductase RutF
VIHVNGPLRQTSEGAGCFPGHPAGGRTEPAVGSLESVTEHVFRHGMRRLAAGVCVLTSLTDDHYCGLTATSVTSVALHPPLIVVSVDGSTETACGIDQTNAFGISMLEAGHEDIARHFATNGLRSKFAGLEVRVGLTGVPLLADAHASIECVVWARHVAGDHLLYVGRVVGADAQDGTQPLVHHMGRYGGVAGPQPLTGQLRKGIDERLRDGR